MALPQRRCLNEPFISPSTHLPAQCGSSCSCWPVERQGRTGARIEDPPALSKANCQLSTPAHMPMRLRVDALAVRLQDRSSSRRPGSLPPLRGLSRGLPACIAAATTLTSAPHPPPPTVLPPSAPSCTAARPSPAYRGYEPCCEVQSTSEHSH